MSMRCAVFAFISLGCLEPLDPVGDTTFSLNVTPEWLCLEEQAAPAFPEPGRVVYTVPVVDFYSQPTAPTPVGGLGIKVCQNPECSPAVPECTGNDLLPCVYITKSPVLQVISFPYAFSNAVLRLSAPGYIDLDYMLGGPMIGTPGGGLDVQGQPVAMLSEASGATIHAALGFPSVDPTLGVLTARTLDCNGQRAAGVTVEALSGNMENATAFSLSNGQQVSPSILRTDERGVAGFINVPAQNIDVQARAPYGRTFAEYTTLQIRPYTITVAELRPGIDVWGQ